MLLNENRIALAQYRLEMAENCLASARRNSEADDFKGSVNRSYYAIFHGIRAVLALEALDFKKHSAVIGKFRELYIKTGIFDVKYSQVIGDAFDVRNHSDYEDFYIVSIEDAMRQIDNAVEFVAAVKEYLEKRVADSEAQ